MAFATANNNVACVILSGGLSSRMNSHKALLPFSGSQNFVEHIIAVYKKAGVEKIILVKNAGIKIDEPNVNTRGASIIDNYFPDGGRLYSLQLGLSAVPNAEHCFIQNIDNPFVTNEVIRRLIEVKTKAEYVTPEYNHQGGHPVLISKKVIEQILALTEYNLTLRDLLQPFSRYKLVTDDTSCIININTPADYEREMMKRPYCERHN